MAAFEELGVCPSLIRAAEELGWMLPTPIQAEAVPLVLTGGDVMAAAETGSGKTGAFSLPALQVCHEMKQEESREKKKKKKKEEGEQRGGATVDPGDEDEEMEVGMSMQERDALFAVGKEGCAGEERGAGVGSAQPGEGFVEAPRKRRRGNQLCQSRSERAWQGGKAACGLTRDAGRCYFEAEVRDEGLCRVGFATAAGSNELGTDRYSFGYGGTGKKSHNRQFENYGTPYTMGDRVGCLLDREKGEILFTLNGRELGVAYTVPTALSKELIFPAVCLKNAEVLLHFHAEDCAHVPAGFLPIGDAPPGWLVSGERGGPTATTSGKGACPHIVILEPARDLAEQVFAEVQHFLKYLTAPVLRAALLVGGVDAKPQIQALRDGVDVIVGTVGRITDLCQQGKLSLSEASIFVLDEADRLLDTGNRDSILSLYSKLRKGTKGIARVQVLMFSATLHSPDIKQLAEILCDVPVWVDLKGANAVPDTVDHVVVMVDPKEDRSYLQSEPEVFTDGTHALEPPLSPTTGETKVGLSEAAKVLKPRLLKRLLDKLDMEQCLIFCRTNHDCDLLERFLNTCGGGDGKAFKGKRESGKENVYSCVVVGAARSMEERRQNLRAFKEGDVRLLICTDVAARGIDIKGLPFVINMTLPDRAEDYVHRIGRVGRAERLGLAVSLIASCQERVWFCTQKGYRPWLNSPVKQKDVDKHTVWYDESRLLVEVEKRVGKKIATMGADLSLPKEIADALTGGRYGIDLAGKNDAAAQEAAEHMVALRPEVELLGELEVGAQKSYWAIRNLEFFH